MSYLSPSTAEFHAVGGELLDGSGFETEDPTADFDPTELLAEEASER